MNLPRTDLLQIAPQLWVITLAMIVLVADAVWPRLNKRGLANFCLLGLGVAGILVAWQWPRGEVRTVMNGMLLPDVYSGFFNLTFISGGAISILLSVDYLDREGIAQGEYYALLLFTTVGMMVMASAAN